VVLFDLDATLFDYTSLRSRATSVSLNGIVSDPELISREVLDLLRPPLTDLLCDLAGLPNLRREWDSPEVLALACLLTENPARQNLMALAHAAGHLRISEDDISLRSRVKRHQYAQRLRDTPLGTDFLRALSRVQERCDGAFPEHVLLFREYISAHADLAEGARDFIFRLLELGAKIQVVSEGDTVIQTCKFQILGLNELAETCVVTDATCSVRPILDELFALCTDSRSIPPEIVQLYDQLAPYTVKSSAFFSKLLHALKDPMGTGLKERIQSTRFCTEQEWEGSPALNLTMIGDRYRKDLEPLLRICPSGAQGYRLLTGRYAAEDPLHDLSAEGRPLPTGVFSGFKELGALSRSIAAPNDPVSRPAPLLPDPVSLDCVLASRCASLSDASRATLAELHSEALRHQNEVSREPRARRSPGAH
jgi:hypothetical protein